MKFESKSKILYNNVFSTVKEQKKIGSKNQDKCIEGMIYVQVQFSEMKEKYVRFQRVHIQKYVDR